MAVTYNQRDVSATFNVGCSGQTAAATTGARDCTVGGTLGSTEVSVDPGNDLTRACFAFDCTPAPGLTNWPSGTWTVNINHSTMDGGTTLTRVDVCAFDGSGYDTVATNTSPGHTAGGTGALEVSVTQAVDFTASASDRPFIVLTYANTDPHGASGLGITPDQTIVAPYTIASERIEVVNETEQASETVGRPLAMVRLRNETEQLADGITRLMGMSRVAPAETVQVSEPAGSVQKQISAGSNESAEINEGTLRFTGLVRVVSEVVQSAEGIVRLLSTSGALIRVINETLQASEATVRARALARVLAETAEISEPSGSVQREISAGSDETVRVIESSLRFLNAFGALVRIINETVLLQEEGNETASAWVQAISETLSISEAELRVRGIVRFVDENVEGLETVLRFASLVRSAAEVVNVVETTVRAAALVRLRSEGIDIGEGSVAARGMTRVVSASLSVAEASLRVLGLIRVENATVNLSETRSSILTLVSNSLVRVISEAVNVATAVNHILGTPPPPGGAPGWQRVWKKFRDRPHRHRNWYSG